MARALPEMDFETVFHSHSDQTDAPTREELQPPAVPGAFVLRAALTPSEVEALSEMVRLTHRLREDGATNEGTLSNEHSRRDSQHHVPMRVRPVALAELARRLRPHLPATAGPRCKAPIEEPGLELSTFLRCYWYKPGDQSKPHFDRSWREHAADGSLSVFSAYSLILYLSDSFEGGHTTFFEEPKGRRLLSRSGLTPLCDRDTLVVAARVTPRSGDALIFPHGTQAGCHPSPLHEGSVVAGGEKLLLRTDVLYKLAEPLRAGRGAPWLDHQGKAKVSAPIAAAAGRFGGDLFRGSASNDPGDGEEEEEKEKQEANYDNSDSGCRPVVGRRLSLCGSSPPPRYCTDNGRTAYTGGQRGDGHLDRRLSEIAGRGCQQGDTEALLYSFDSACDDEAALLPLLPAPLHIGPERGQWLDAAMRTRAPMTALEVGTHIGYSALCIARLLPHGGRLWTVEPNLKNAELAEANLAHAGLLGDKVTVLRGTLDDGDLRQQLPCPVDVVFLDHRRAVYRRDISNLERWGYITVGTVVVADDIGGQSKRRHADLMADKYAESVRSCGAYNSAYHFGGGSGIEVSEATAVGTLVGSCPVEPRVVTERWLSQAASPPEVATLTRAAGRVAATEILRRREEATKARLARRAAKTGCA